MSKLDGFLQRIAGTISTNLIDPLGDKLGTKVEQILTNMTPGLAKVIAEQGVPPIEAAVIAEFEKQMPQLIEAVVRAVATSFGDLVSRTTDRATDMIPGELDDMVDGVVKNIMGGLFGTNEP